MTKRTALLIAGLSAAAVATARAQGTGADTAALREQVTRAAERWAALLDSGQYDVSWDSAAPLLRGMISRDRWPSMAVMMRGPAETIGGRRLTSIEYDATFPGAPPGRYVQLAYALSTPAGEVSETIVVQQTGDTWRVAMYGVRGR